MLLGRYYQKWKATRCDALSFMLSPNTSEVKVYLKSPDYLSQIDQITISLFSSMISELLQKGSKDEHIKKCTFSPSTKLPAVELMQDEIKKDFPSGLIFTSVKQTGGGVICVLSLVDGSLSVKSKATSEEKEKIKESRLDTQEDAVFKKAAIAAEKAFIEEYEDGDALSAFIPPADYSTPVLGKQALGELFEYTPLYTVSYHKQQVEGAIKFTS